MIEQTVRLGIDRFIAKRWADYALDLRISGIQDRQAYAKLQSWLVSEIEGKEVLLKTASQLKRMWMVEDKFSQLRKQAIQISYDQGLSSRSVLHYGMALNVFPFFRDMCSAIGRLVQLQGRCQTKEVEQRLLEKYGTPSTIQRATRRGFQTLVNWGFLVTEDNYFVSCPIEIDFPAWFIQALLFNSAVNETSLTDMVHSPEALGIIFTDFRSTIRQTKNLFLERNGRNEEIVVFRTGNIAPIIDN